MLIQIRLKVSAKSSKKPVTHDENRENFEFNVTRNRILTKKNIEIFEKDEKKLNSESDFIFIGGYARSGTTLMVLYMTMSITIRCPGTLMVIRVVLPFIFKTFFGH